MWSPERAKIGIRTPLKSANYFRFVSQATGVEATTFVSRMQHLVKMHLDRPSNQFFPSVSQSVFVNRSVVERLRPQFFTYCHEILHAAQKCGRFVACCLRDKPEIVCRF